MSFDSKNNKKNSPFMQYNSSDFEDSRLERVSSAPPQSACSLFGEEEPFQFVLTNEDGTPLQIDYSDETEELETVSTHKDENNMKELEKLKELESSIAELSLLEAQANKNSKQELTSSQLHTMSSSRDVVSPMDQTSIPKSSSTVEVETKHHSRLSDLNKQKKIDMTMSHSSCNDSKLNSKSSIYQSNNQIQMIQSENDLQDATGKINKLKDSIQMVEQIQNKESFQMDEIQKIIHEVGVPGDWEIEMESEGEDNTDEFSKFMSIEKLMHEFSNGTSSELLSKIHCPPDLPKINQISSFPTHYPSTGLLSVSEIKDQLESLDAKENTNNNDLEDWDFEFESDENQNLSEFVKFMQIEKLTQQFSAVNTFNVLEEVLHILRISERTPVDVKFINNKSKNFDKSSGDTCSAKMQVLKNKISTGMEKIRIEFNRATGSNVASVIENIKKIQIEKVQEMKEVASFVFEKIISEPIYFDVYLQIVGQLKASNWKCEEEAKMVDKTQTCFFGTLLSLAKRRLEADHDWFASIDESSLSYSNRADLEDQIEDKVADKIKKKEHALGAVNFLVTLYLKNITGLANAQMVIDKLLSRNSAEYIVMLCYVYKPLMEKLVHMNRNDLANRIISYLKANEKNTKDVRLQLDIEKALKYNPMISVTPVKSPPKNSFEGLLAIENDNVSLKSDTEILQTYISDMVTSVSSFTDEDEIIEFGNKIYKDVDRFNNTAFYIAYFIELVSNYKYFTRLLNILLTKLLPKMVDIKEVLDTLKEEMDMLSIDVACASKNYAELLCHLRALNKLTNEEFESYKLPQFTKHSSVLLKKWKETSDPKLQLVASEEEIQKLNNF